MSFDGIVLHAVALELEKSLQGARIDKIYQPTKHQIILTLRQRGQNYKLLLSSGPGGLSPFCQQNPVQSCRTTFILYGAAQAPRGR
jgi:predicted ribosome quality control (RQC) complex YloA/Tae2 family protein